MWPWRSLVPTIEIVMWGAPSLSRACDSPACVGGATSSNEASATALIYDARMRIVSWGLGLLVMTGAACGGGLRTPDGGGGSGGAGGADPNRWAGVLGVSINRNVDVLFLVDDSSSMRLAQDNLRRSLPAFMTRLQDPPYGLPNIHIAVVSQDMGAGDGSISSCNSTGGKNGIFQYTARGTCAATNLQAGATYISNVGGVANYTGNVADVFSCIAALGETGCGYEHQFAAILRALGADGKAPPAENQSFLRPDAYLAIVMLTNEDDCSERPGVKLFDTASNTTLASMFGPPANFRCNEFGHMCDSGSGTYAHPGRAAPNNDLTAMVTYQSCRSNDEENYLLSVTDTANRIKALKADPSQVAVVSIQGPVAPYTVTWKSPSTSDTSCGAASCPWPVIAHTCTAGDGSFADPGVRTSELVQAFGGNGLVLPICTDDLAPALDRAAMLINSLLSPRCLPGLVGENPTTGLPDCKVTAHDSDGLGGFIDRSVPACADNGDTAPCWQLVKTPMCVAASVLDISPDPTLPATASGTVSYSCAKCQSADGLGCY